MSKLIVSTPMHDLLFSGAAPRKIKGVGGGLGKLPFSVSQNCSENHSIYVVVRSVILSTCYGQY